MAKKKMEADWGPEIDFGDSQLAMTYKPGQTIGGKGDKPDTEANRRSRQRWASVHDLEDSNKAVDAFAKSALTNLYGRNWQKRKDILFAFVAIPEYKSRSGTRNKNLHYHITFGYLQETEIKIYDVKAAFIEAAKKIDNRMFGVTSELYLEEVKHLDAYIDYSRKNLASSGGKLEPTVILSMSQIEGFGSDTNALCVAPTRSEIARDKEDLKANAVVAGNTNLLTPHMEQLEPLEMRGASNEAGSTDPKSKALVDQESGEISATNKPMPYKIINNQKHTNKNNNTSKYQYKIQNMLNIVSKILIERLSDIIPKNIPKISYTQITNHTQGKPKRVQSRHIELPEASSSEIHTIEIEPSNFLVSDISDISPKSVNDNVLTSNTKLEPAEPLIRQEWLCYPVRVEYHGNAAGVEQFETVYFDCETCIPATKFDSARIGSVCGVMAYLKAGQVWEETGQLFPELDADRRAWRRKDLIRKELANLLNSYLLDNYKWYYRFPERYYYSIDRAAKATCEGTNYIWENRFLVDLADLLQSDFWPDF
jgi:hypothetical protein